jgi:ABC-2 type transport system permease protein
MAAFRIALKDIRQRLRDRSAYLWGIVAPLGLAAIFSLLLGNIAGPGSLHISYVVADEDGGPAARAFVNEVLVPLSNQGVLTLRQVADAGSAQTLVSDGKVDAAFVILPGFSSAVESNAAASIQVVANVDSPIGGEVARSIAGQYAGRINSVRTALGTYFTLLKRVPEPGEVTRLQQAALGQAAPLTVGEVKAASKELSLKTFYSASMAILFLFLTVQFGVLGLLEEKQNGTMCRLLAAPMLRSSIVAGKALTSLVMGLASMAVLVMGTTLLLGARWGNSLGVAVLVVAGVIAAMGIMFVVAAFARTPEQAGNLQSIVAFLLALLGGVFVPIAQAGGIVAKLSLITPHAWFLRGLGDLAAGGGVRAVFPAALYVALFGLITGGLAQLRVGRVLEP